MCHGHPGGGAGQTQELCSEKALPEAQECWSDCSESKETASRGLGLEVAVLGTAEECHGDPCPG